MNHSELMEILNGIENYFRENKAHEHLIYAINVSKGLADRLLSPKPLVISDISATHTNFNCPTCGFTYCQSKHPIGHEPSKIQLTENDRHCPRCGQRIMMSYDMCLENCNDDITTSEYTM